MAKRSSKKEHDFSVNAFHVVQEATGDGEPEKDSLPAAKRGKARVAKLTPERRREIAQRAAKALWQGKGLFP